jgi:dihydroflavonol-4-reductase
MSEAYAIDTAAPVLVTGATGYVAGWIVKRLVESGVTVHAAVRAPHDAAKVDHLRAIGEAGPGAVKLFRGDLLTPESYAEAMAGCTIVFHTASPFATQVADPQRDLVEPALEGTRNVLSTVNDTASVARVVLTSSCAAIYADATDAEAAPGGRLTEEMWNTTASLDYQPYSYSKTVAEREAWRIAEAQDGWRLVVVNPSLVVGPAVNPRPTSESFKIVKQMADGTMRMGAPRIALGAVDVRDVAEAHLAAAYTPKARGRHIVSGHDTDFVEMAKALLPRYGARYALPRRSLPKWLVWLIGPVAAGLPRRFVAHNVGHVWRADNSKSIRELGVSYRPLATSMEEMFGDMVDKGLIAAK